MVERKYGCFQRGNIGLREHKADPTQGFRAGEIPDNVRFPSFLYLKFFFKNIFSVTCKMELHRVPLNPNMLKLLIWN